MGSMVDLGLRQSIKSQYRHYKNRIKSEYFSPRESVQEAKQNMPPEKDWKKGQEAWEKQVDWWAEPQRVEKSQKNAENRAKRKTVSYQGSKSFAQGRHEYYVKKGRYQDLITHWRDKHSHESVFDNSENEALYARMKSIKDQVDSHAIGFKSDKEIIAEVTKSASREHEAGVGRKLPLGGCSSRICPEPSREYCNREQIKEIIRLEIADKEKWKKAAEEASEQAKLANERAKRVESFLENFVNHYNRQQTQAGGISFSPPSLPTSLVPGTVSALVPDAYSDPNRYYKLMNPGCSRIPNDDEEYGDDQDGADEDGSGNDESSSSSDEEQG